MHEVESVSSLKTQNKLIFGLLKMCWERNRIRSDFNPPSGGVVNLYEYLDAGKVAGWVWEGGYSFR